MAISRLFYLMIVWLLVSCSSSNEARVKTFSDHRGNKLGDSVFINNRISKIIYSDSSQFIDSIVMERYPSSGQLKTVNSFLGGKKAFENISYYEGGEVMMYEFIDPDNEQKSLIVAYGIDGDTVVAMGGMFMYGFIKVIPEYMPESKELVIRKENSIRLRVFHPAPPRFSVKLYIEDNSNGTINNVFEKENQLNFAQSVFIRGGEVGFYSNTIWLELTSFNPGKLFIGTKHIPSKDKTFKASTSLDWTVVE